VKGWLNIGRCVLYCWDMLTYMMRLFWSSENWMQVTQLSQSQLRIDLLAEAAKTEPENVLAEPEKLGWVAYRSNWERYADEITLRWHWCRRMFPVETVLMNYWSRRCPVSDCDDVASLSIYWVTMSISISGFSVEFYALFIAITTSFCL